MKIINSKAGTMKHYIYMFLIVLVGLPITLVALLWLKENKPAEPQPEREKMAIAVTAVKYRDLSDVRVFTGNLKANSTFDLATKVPGRLETLTVTTGNRSIRASWWPRSTT